MFRLITVDMKIFTPKFSLKAEADMLNKLSLYLSAHMSLNEALQILEDQSESRRKKETFRRWRGAVESGKTLAQAFTDGVGMAVSEISRYAAELGERSGALARSLKEAHVQIRKTLDLKKKIVGATAYPTVILIGTVGLILGLMLFVFPKIIPLFETLKVQLPFSTRLLIGLSRLLSEHWLILILVLSASVSSVVLLTEFSQKSRVFLDYALIRIPLVGQVVRLRIICGTFDSLLTLLRGGEQLSTALSGVSKTMKSAEYKAAFKLAGETVAQGRSLAQFFREKSKLFPLYIFGIVSVGEKTGNMENSVENVSEITREELDDKLRILTAALEPALMVSMSFVIGFIALSIILPIYGITSHFQNV